MPGIDSYSLDNYGLDGPINKSSRTVYSDTYDITMSPNTTIYQELFVIPNGNGFVDAYPTTTSNGTSAILTVHASTNGGNGQGDARVALVFQDDAGRRSQETLVSTGQYNNGIGFLAMNIDRENKVVNFIQPFKHTTGDNPLTSYTLPASFNMLGKISVQVKHVSNPAASCHGYARVTGVVVTT
ncbi:hypothetical protein [Paenibacillus sp. FSL R5-0519]|uniref:hypothetical protein n=1 Tax=Paenibacillus sp. FSL R5-0519 TaxID=2921648 RepID=UPI0030D8899D